MRSVHATTTADTLATVTIGDWPADGYRHEGTVEVINRDGADEIYFTVNGSVPDEGLADTYVVPKVAGAGRTVPVATAGNPVVKLISTLATKYSVLVDL